MFSNKNKPLKTVREEQEKRKSRRNSKNKRKQKRTEQNKKMGDSKKIAVIKREREIRKLQLEN